MVEANSSRMESVARLGRQALVVIEDEDEKDRKE